ncbi:MAG: prepilin-type N-terminal cleavage/methylation domain-containing protein, partial [Fusobacterium sp.]|nr:prepilin-type N-terminal cleavage/methylation domain-containing protein [Fusobacterium sp.]
TVSPKASGWIPLSGFTMAEILLSLTIIGVVAAITLPSLTGNINERTWNTQRKALYARFSQAIALMPSLNGYGIGATQEETNSKAAETFVTSGLSKVLKINNVCDATHLSDCGMPAKITTLQANSLDFPTNLSELNERFTSAFVTSSGHSFIPPQMEINTDAAAFETANGESVAVFYNPSCQADMNENVESYGQSKMCANFIYDLNGTKGPNTVGKDIGFITALYSADPNVVMPVPLVNDAAGGQQLKLRENGTSPALSACRQQEAESRLPNRDELTAMFFNMNLIDLQTNDYWSGQVVGQDAWGVKMQAGTREIKPYNTTRYVRCVKR